MGATGAALGSGMNYYVYTLAFDAAQNLYTGGGFTTAGGNPASNIARWVGVGVGSE